MYLVIVVTCVLLLDKLGYFVDTGVFALKIKNVVIDGYATHICDLFDKQSLSTDIFCIKMSYEIQIWNNS